MTKCQYCNLSIDRDRDNHVVMPVTDQCGARARMSRTGFAHARCYEKVTIQFYLDEQRRNAEFAAELVETQ